MTVIARLDNIEEKRNTAKHYSHATFEYCHGCSKCKNNCAAKWYFAGFSTSKEKAEKRSAEKCKYLKVVKKVVIDTVIS